MRKNSTFWLVWLFGLSISANFALANNETESEEAAKKAAKKDSTPSVPPLRKAMSFFFGDKKLNPQSERFEAPLTPPARAQRASQNNPPVLRPAAAPPAPVTQKEQSSTIVKEPLCTVVACNSASAAGQLQVHEGDVVTLMEAEQLPQGMVFARNGQNEGFLPLRALQLDQHASNTYLKMGDFLVAHPHLLARLLLVIDQRAEKDLDMIVDVLAARRLLSQALQALFELEMHDPTQANNLFRLRTPAVILCTAILNRPGPLQTFRVEFLQQVIGNAKKRYKPKDLSSIVEVLRTSIEPFAHRPEVEFPPEVSLVMNALRKAAVRNAVNQNQLSVLLGSMFCLRYLSPALAQPKSFLNAGVSPAMAETLRTLAKALQLVSNQIDPDESNCFLCIAEAMRTLHEPTARVHHRLANFPSRNLSVTRSQINNALNLYRIILNLPAGVADPREIALLRELLGDPFPGVITREEEAPRYAEIRRLRTRIGKMDPNAL